MVCYLRGVYQVSQERACRVARIPVSTFRYQSTQEPRTALRLRIREIAQEPGEPGDGTWGQTERFLGYYPAFPKSSSVCDTSGIVRRGLPAQSTTGQTQAVSFRTLTQHIPIGKVLYLTVISTICYTSQRIGWPCQRLSLAPSCSLTTESHRGIRPSFAFDGANSFVSP